MFDLEREGVVTFFVSRYSNRVIQAKPDGQCLAANTNRLGWEAMTVEPIELVNPPLIITPRHL